MTTCTRCRNTGFLNTHQIEETEYAKILRADDPIAATLAWIQAQEEPHNVQVCDCCGDGEQWYGKPGEHYGPDDPIGQDGPYGYNGGLCECD